MSLLWTWRIHNTMNQMYILFNELDFVNFTIDHWNLNKLLLFLKITYVLLTGCFISFFRRWWWVGVFVSIYMYSFVSCLCCMPGLLTYRLEKKIYWFLSHDVRQIATSLFCILRKILKSIEVETIEFGEELAKDIAKEVRTLVRVLLHSLKMASLRSTSAWGN